MEVDNEWPWENFGVRRSPFPTGRICQYTELLNMGGRESTRNSTSTISSYRGHCVRRVYGIVYHRVPLFRGDECFWSCYRH
ncbi:hypothetical protein TNCV_4888711 [Trichonephila clavipes]|nr:hypothetical protein TNCV_4888711 [Trichonephila clavipes]